MGFLHIGDKIIDEINGEFFVRGQRQYQGDGIKKTKVNILKDHGVDLDDIALKSINAETYTKNKTLSNFEGDPVGFANWQAEEKIKAENLLINLGT